MDQLAGFLSSRIEHSHINDVGNVASSREIIVGTGSIGLQRGSNVEKV